MNAAGRSLHALGPWYPLGYDSDGIAWAPDSRRVAFVVPDPRPRVTCNGMACNGDVYVASADGTSRHRLTRGSAVRSVAWPSPNEIAYAGALSGIGSGVVVLLLHSPAAHLLDNGAAGLVRSSSHDSLAFVLTHGVRTQTIVLERPNGRQRTELAPIRNVAHFWSLAWSPNGRWLAFGESANARPFSSAIFLVRRDGSGLHRVVGSGAGGAGGSLTPAGSTPVWSPDSTRIAVDTNTGLYTVRIDGTGVKRVALSLPADHRLSLDAWG